MKRKRLGQHYLVDDSVVKAMVDLAEIKRSDRVLEVGTGKGVLTAALCRLSRLVEAYEVDAGNYAETESLGLDGLRLHLADAFLTSPEFNVLVSSLPYSRSYTFIEWLSRLSYDRAVVLLQEDFVLKLMARPGDGAYRAVSVISQLSSTVEVARKVGKASFNPPPRVTSAIVLIRAKTRLSEREISLIKALFSQRRRRLSAAMRELGLPGQVNHALLSRRVNTLTPSEMGEVLEGIE